MSIEEALRQRRREVEDNIRKDEALAEDYRKRTSLRTAHDKRFYRSLQDRIQVEWYKHSEQSMIAYRANVEL